MSTQLRDWINSHTDADRQRLADGAGTTVAYLWQLAGGHRKATIEMIAKLHKASYGALTLEGLRPDLAEFFEKPRKRRAAA